jgi:hypothetical protein
LKGREGRPGYGIGIGMVNIVLVEAQAARKIDTGAEREEEPEQNNEAFTTPHPYQPHCMSLSGILYLFYSSFASKQKRGQKKERKKDIHLILHSFIQFQFSNSKTLPFPPPPVPET